MLFNSYAFLLAFLPLTLLLTFLAARHSSRAAIFVLSLASLLFYAWGELRFLPILCASILFNFLMGRAIARARNKGRRRRVRALLALGVGADLLSIGYFKYAGFFVSSTAAFLGVEIPAFDVVLPLGISFFTFTQIAFLADSAKGEASEYDFMRYLLFVTYFPHLIAGPILHHRDTIAQFAKAGAFRLGATDLAAGGSLFLIGLFKKVALADSIAPVADRVFTMGAQLDLTMAEAWVGALAYALQIYFDFSGYSDMALGLSRMMGVRFPLNFNSPYKATSIIDFWRRWHMSLSRFLRDYLYVPLGGNRKGALRRHANLMVTMLLGGLWHGAAWTFVAWGALHGFYLVVNHAWRRWAPAGQGFLARLFGWAATFAAVLVAWVYFRADTLTLANKMVWSMLGGNGLPLPAFAAQFLNQVAGLSLTGGGTFANALFEFSDTFPKLALLLIVALALPNAQSVMARYRPALERVRRLPALLSWRPDAAWGVAAGLAFAILLTLLGGESPFLYFRF